MAIFRGWRCWQDRELSSLYYQMLEKCSARFRKESVGRGVWIARDLDSEADASDLPPLRAYPLANGDCSDRGTVQKDSHSIGQSASSFDDTFLVVVGLWFEARCAQSQYRT
jgi:hypothetical protein